ncbi:hypothetical protein L7F22_008795 [Adiantum nelumboides]|nr:hypothetical protein [Adiantum nelumboides]
MSGGAEVERLCSSESQQCTVPMPKADMQAILGHKVNSFEDACDVDCNEMANMVRLAEIALGLRHGFKRGNISSNESDTERDHMLFWKQHIWDEVGESDAERDQMLLQLEQECLQEYRCKVDLASHARARLQKALASFEAGLTSLISHLGDRSFLGRSEKQVGTLKEKLSAVQPQLDELRQKLDERMQQFIDGLAAK